MNTYVETDDGDEDRDLLFFPPLFKIGIRTDGGMVSLLLIVTSLSEVDSSSKPR